jgi:hypothetical protein
MGVRDEYKTLLLGGLRESPAWNLFVEVLLGQMSFIQDDLVFTMGNLPITSNLSSKLVEGNPTTLTKDTIYRLLIDTTASVEVTNCKVSEDKDLWTDSIQSDVIYIKPKVTGLVESFTVSVVSFFPTEVRQKSWSDYMDLDGLLHSEVVDSSFDENLSATSPLLINNILKRNGYNCKIEYRFSDGDVDYLIGAHQEKVIKGLFLEKVKESTYRYVTLMTLVPGEDQIYYSGELINIKSVNKNTVVLSKNIPSGRYSVLRNNYLVPLALNYRLLSALELDFTEVSDDFAKRFSKRVTPARCTSVSLGKVNIRITGYLTISDIVNKPRVVTTSHLSILDTLDVLENYMLRVLKTKVKEGDNDVYDSVVSNKEFETISLL